MRHLKGGHQQRSVRKIDDYDGLQYIQFKFVRERNPTLLVIELSFELMATGHDYWFVCLSKS